MDFLTRWKSDFFGLMWAKLQNSGTKTNLFANKSIMSKGLNF